MKKKIMAAAGIFAGTLYLSYRGNHCLDICHYTYTDPKLPASFAGQRILHLSDVHNTSFGYHQKSILKQIYMSSPDAIVITGDLIDRRRTSKANMQPVKRLIAQAINIAPIYYVPGNHEATSSIYPHLKQYLLDQGVHVLENSKIELSRQEESITLLGIKDPKFYASDAKRWERNLQSLMDTVDTSFTILLSHRPERFEQYSQRGVNLVFCGHAHGGQIVVPKLGALYAPDQGILPSYTDGLYEKDGCTMVVSRGLGNSRAPQRINNHPQISVVTLQKSNESNPCSA